MANEGFGVRVFEIGPDGALEPFLGVDEDYFRGTVPNVGDTIAKWGLHDVYTFYSVQRRYFIDSPDADNGWCVVVRLIEPAEQLQNVVSAWMEDTEFWRDIGEQGRQEELNRVRKNLRKLTEKKPSRQTTAKKPPAKKPARRPRKRVLTPPNSDK